MKPIQNQGKRWGLSRRSALAALAAITSALALLPQQARAQVDVPFYADQRVAPNILFVVDASAEMGAEFDLVDGLPINRLDGVKRVLTGSSLFGGGFGNGVLDSFDSLVNFSIVTYGGDPAFNASSIVFPNGESETAFVDEDLLSLRGKFIVQGASGGAPTTQAVRDAGCWLVGANEMEAALGDNVCPPTFGPAPLTADVDPSFQCRRSFIILLTAGKEDTGWGMEGAPAGCADDTCAPLQPQRRIQVASALHNMPAVPADNGSGVKIPVYSVLVGGCDPSIIDPLDPAGCNAANPAVVTATTWAEFGGTDATPDPNDCTLQSAGGDSAYLTADEASLNISLRRILECTIAGSHGGSEPTFVTTSSDFSENQEIDGFFEIDPEDPWWRGHLAAFSFETLNDLANSNQKLTLDAADWDAGELLTLRTQANARKLYVALDPAYTGFDLPEGKDKKDKKDKKKKKKDKKKIELNLKIKNGKVEVNKGDFSLLFASLMSVPPPSLMAEFLPNSDASMFISDSLVLPETTVNQYITFLRDEDGAAETLTFPTGEVKTWSLGAIINSDPVIASPPHFDFRVGAGETYANFIRAHVDDPTLIFVGAQDGFMHAFIQEDSAGITQLDPGGELWGFMPYGAVLKIPDLQLGTVATVDGDPVVSTVKFYGDPTDPTDDSFHTVLLFGLGQGGLDYVALDITDPLQPQLLWQVSTFMMGNTTSTPNVGQYLIDWNGTALKRSLMAVGGGTIGDIDILEFLKRFCTQVLGGVNCPSPIDLVRVQDNFEDKFKVSPDEVERKLKIKNYFGPGLDAEFEVEQKNKGQAGERLEIKFEIEHFFGDGQGFAGEGNKDFVYKAIIQPGNNLVDVWLDMDPNTGQIIQQAQHGEGAPNYQIPLDQFPAFDAQVQALLAVNFGSKFTFFQSLTTNFQNQVNAAWATRTGSKFEVKLKNKSNLAQNKLKLEFKVKLDDKANNTKTEVKFKIDSDQGLSLAGIDLVPSSVFFWDVETGQLVQAVEVYDDPAIEAQNTVPGDILALDRDLNGTIDNVVFGDLEGKLWKVLTYFPDPADWITNATGDPNAPAGESPCLLFDQGSLAPDLGVTPLEAQRPIYSAPAATFDCNGFVNLIWGTGDPRDKNNPDTQDFLFAINDPDASSCGAGNPKMAARDFTCDEVKDTKLKKAIDDTFPFKLNPGEKILSSPLIVNGKFFVSTFQPSGSVANADVGCEAGTGRLISGPGICCRIQRDPDVSSLTDVLDIQDLNGALPPLVVGPDGQPRSPSDLGGTTQSVGARLRKRNLLHWVDVFGVADIPSPGVPPDVVVGP